MSALRESIIAALATVDASHDLGSDDLPSVEEYADAVLSSLALEPEAREVADARRITKPEFDIALGHFRAVFNDRSMDERGSRPALLAALKSLGIAVTDG